jgi:hypothetical protein
MRISIFILSFLFTTLAFTQSKEVNLIFKHTHNGQELKLDESVFSIWNGKKISLRRADFYLSNLKIRNKEAQLYSFANKYLLVKANNADQKYQLGKIELNNIDQLSFSVGIDSVKNHQDPSLYPLSNPLGLQEPSMHWGWAGGYRFMAIEGKVDVDGDGKPEENLEFHNLGDALYKEAKININIDESKPTIDIVIILDYAKLFNKLTLIGNTIVHGSSTKNITMINNAVDGGFFEQQLSSSIHDAAIFDLNIKQTNQYFNVVFDNPSNDEVLSIFDLQGKMVYKTKISNNETLIPKSLLPSSILVFSISKGNKILGSKKVLNSEFR